jgi:hypothetical protein
MPAAHNESTPHDDHVLTDVVQSLGWEGSLVLVTFALLLTAQSPRARRVIASMVRAIVHELRLLKLVRMGTTRTMAKRLQKDSWDAMCAHRGLTGLVRGKIRKTTYGVAVHVRLGGALTVDVLTSKLRQVETGISAQIGSIRVVPRKRADRAVLAITLRNPLASALAWPGHPSRDIRKAIALGRDETGARITVKARQRFVVAGTSGAGKSVFLRIIGASAVVSTNARLSYIDLKAVEASLWQRIPGVDVATTPDQVRELVNRIGARMRERLHAMAVRGDVDHEPTVQEPAEIIIVDEGAELKRAGLDDVVTQLESMAQLGRAADFWLVWASQYPTDKSGGLPIGIGTQAEAVAGLRVESPRINRNVFGEDAGSTGWSADTLPGGGGWFLLRDAEHTAPERARAYLLDADDVRKLAPTNPQTPVLPAAESVIPPMPTVAPTVHLVKKAIEDARPVEQPAPRKKIDVKVTMADEIRMALAFAPEPLGNNEIARQIGRDRGAVSRVVSKLVAAGEITASQDKKYTLVLATADQADHTEGTEA